MNEKEKYQAVIDAQLAQFGETLNQLKTKRELRNESMPALQLDTTSSKHKAATEKLKQLEKSDAGVWETIKSEVDGLMADIDDELRQAMAYFG